MGGALQVNKSFLLLFFKKDASSLTSVFIFILANISNGNKSRLEVGFDRLVAAFEAVT